MHAKLGMAPKHRGKTERKKEKLKKQREFSWARRFDPKLEAVDKIVVFLSAHTARGTHTHTRTRTCDTQHVSTPSDRPERTQKRAAHTK